MYTVITENDESQWDDDTGVLYHFPKRYAKYLKPGTRVVYYKGALKDRKYSFKRLSDVPHYFGIATIGNVYPDKKSLKGDLFAVIVDYRMFEIPILAKNNTGYIEPIPASRKNNYWRDGVRTIDKQTYDKILRVIPAHKIREVSPVYDSDETNDLDNGLESFQEGERKLRYVTLYERDPKLRRQAIAIHGTTCLACGFNFEKVYGEYAKDHIQVHHVVPVSKFGETKQVNPETDLIPLCANCHCVVHRKRTRTLSISELRDLIASASNKAVNQT